MKYLVVAVDYFTKWIEVKPLAKIIAQKIEDFTWKNIVCKFELPYAIVTDNGTQLTDKIFKGFCERLGIKQIFSSVEHLQSNGQAKPANKVILQGLKKRLDQAKRRWIEELHSVLWAYHTTIHFTTGEMPNKLTHGSKL